MTSHSILLIHNWNVFSVRRQDYFLGLWSKKSRKFELNKKSCLSQKATNLCKNRRNFKCWYSSYILYYFCTNKASLKSYSGTTHRALPLFVEQANLMAIYSFREYKLFWSHYLLIKNCLVQSTYLFFFLLLAHAHFCVLVRHCSPFMQVNLAFFIELIWN